MENIFLENSSVDSIIDIIDHLNDESITILSELLSIPTNDSQRDSVKNIIVSQIDLHNTQINADFIEIINNLHIIQKQIVPQTIINQKFLNRTFYFIQTVNKESKDIFIHLPNQNQNETIYMQLIPDGLTIFPDFLILENEHSIKSNQLNNSTYIKLQNSAEGEETKLTFVNFPQNLIFFQILFYKKMTNDELFQYFRKELNIPREISNLEARICHTDHSFGLIQLIDSVQQNDSILCPLCFKKAEHLFFDTNVNEEILDYILDDDESKVINLVLSTGNDHVFRSKFQIPIILRNQPSFLSLCAFFGSTKCFFSLLNFYLRKNELFRINQKDQLQRSPIHFACFGGDLSIVEALIKNNEKLDFSDSNGMTPIHYAAMNGKIKIIKYFYQSELNMFPCSNHYSLTPLHLACEFGYLGIVRFYCQIVIPCSEINGLDGFLNSFCKSEISPLHCACKGGKIDIVNFLLSFSDFSYKQIRMNSIKTPLMCACEFGSLDCVKALLNSGFSFDDQQIMKAFDISILNGHLDVISFMIKKLNIKISIIMILAAIANNHFEVAKFLLNNYSSNNESLLSLTENLNRQSNIEIDELNGENQLELNNTNIERRTNLNNQQNLPVPAISVNNQQNLSMPAISVNNQQNLSIPAISVNNQQNLSMPAVSINNQQNLSMPSISINNQQNLSMPAISINNQQNLPINVPQAPLIPLATDLSMIGYYKIYNGSTPLDFVDLLNMSFSSKNKVKIAVQNISMIVKKSVHVSKSEERRMVFKCIKGCSFSMTWKEVDGMWYVQENCFVDHSCTAENAKMPKIHYNLIDDVIKMLPLENLDMNAKIKVISDYFGNDVDKRTIRKRLNK